MQRSMNWSQASELRIAGEGCERRSKQAVEKGFPCPFQRRFRKAWFSLRSRNQALGGA
jgi:hypothetical protein